MPIRSDLRHFYTGPAWQAVRSRIRDRAADRCEHCQVPNHARVYRRGGWWYDAILGQWRDWLGAPWAPGPPRHFRRRLVRIVCAVVHLNHTPGDDRDDNLRFLCQWCHLHYDAGKHRETRQIRKDAARPLLVM